jgi:hypothetical protein
VWANACRPKGRHELENKEVGKHETCKKNSLTMSPRPEGKGNDDKRDLDNEA